MLSILNYKNHSLALPKRSGRALSESHEKRLNREDAEIFGNEIPYFVVGWYSFSVVQFRWSAKLFYQSCYSIIRTKVSVLSYDLGKCV